MWRSSLAISTSDVSRRRVSIRHWWVCLIAASSVWKFKAASSSKRRWSVCSTYGRALCNVISNIRVFLWTSLLPWISHQNQHSAGIKSYVLNTTEIIEHTGTDSHFPYSMKILINFCFFFNNEYAIILFTFLLFVLPRSKTKLDLQWLDSCTRIETEKKKP